LFILYKLTATAALLPSPPLSERRFCDVSVTLYVTLRARLCVCPLSRMSRIDCMPHVGGECNA